MKRNYNSIYKSSLNLQGDATLVLSADERMMLCEALTNCAPRECDILPLMILMDRLVKGE